MEIKEANWGNTPNGQPVSLFTLTNSNGNYVQLTNYGATWVSAFLPDKNGKKESVVLGFPTLQGYLEDTCYIGASVGRFANRIENASFTINGTTHKVSANVNGIHCLHGGEQGINFRVWHSKIEKDGVTFSLLSPDGDQGFPGEVNITVNYQWTDDNKLNINFKATTNKPTPISLTNHAYFNLKGSGTIAKQQLKINANQYLPMKEGCIVTGEKRNVESSVFDFRSFKPIGQDIDANDEQIKLCAGYDESFVIKDTNDGKMQDIAEAFDPETGRAMKMSSTLPTVHLYTANFLSSTQPGHNGNKYGKREAFCLEAQFAPNTPNISHLPSCILQPGETFNHTISIQFSTK